MKLPQLLRRILHPGRRPSKPYEPKSYWTERGRTYKQEFHQRFVDGLATDGSDRNIALLEEVLRKDRVESLCDVGCGYGLYLKSFEADLPKLTCLAGCDISPTLVAEARQFLGPASRVTVSETDGVRLPYSDKSFDGVLTYGVCIHVPPARLDAFLQELLRVCRRYHLFIESSDRASAGAHRHYFAHDYLASFGRLGARMETLVTLNPQTGEALCRARVPS
jgi:SAM-dependent methyltransferase